MTLKDLKIKIFADGADLESMLRIHGQGLVQGLTTNPTLMRKAGISDYAAFAKSVLDRIRDMPISFEVFSEDFEGMEREARKIAAWGPNVYVKVPISDIHGKPSTDLIRRLSAGGVRLNVTAILTLDQVRSAVGALSDGTASIISVFAGRVADTGRDPMPLMAEALKVCRGRKGCELLWASTRELYNIYQAEQIGVDIITVTPDVLAKGSLVGMDLAALSLDTVRMFDRDAKAAGFNIG